MQKTDFTSFLKTRKEQLNNTKTQDYFIHSSLPFPYMQK